MGERQSVLTVLGDETPNVQMLRALKDTLLLAALRGFNGVIDFNTHDAIGVTGSFDYDVNTGRMVIRAERK